MRPIVLGVTALLALSLAIAGMPLATAEPPPGPPQEPCNPACLVALLPSDGPGAPCRPSCDATIASALDTVKKIGDPSPCRPSC